MPLSDQDRATFSAYLDGELDDDTRRRVEKRLSLDPSARAEYDAMRQAWGLLDYLPRAAPSGELTHRTLERLIVETQQARPRAPIARRLLVTAGWAAAIMLAAGLGVTLGGWLPTGGVDPNTEIDEALVQHLRVIERWPLYQHADDLDFVRQLDQPDLFGDEAGS